MAPTIELIESITLSSSAANVTFSNIPQDYDDLLLVMSIRTARASPFTIEGIDIWFNSDTTSGNYTKRRLLGQGSSASSDTGGSLLAPTNGATSSTFSNNEVYVPNYAGASNKSYSVTSAAEHNSTTAYLAAGAELWSDTSAITSIQLVPAANNLVTGSSFELYGIKDADDGAEGYFGPAAQGGDEVYTTGDGYKVHVFKSSGTLTVTNPGEVEYLVVAGGGGGATGGTTTNNGHGGGGAGGYLTGTLSLASSVTVMVGAGGRGALSADSFPRNGGNGSNSAFGPIESDGGGGGGDSSTDGLDGGSGGGGGGNNTATNPAGGTATSGQGNDGGDGFGSTTSSSRAGGGGGGAGGAGSDAGGANGGDGGPGLSSTISGSSVTRGGGGGGGSSGGGTGGSGGGGNGGSNGSGVSGSANSGGGGGGAGSDNVTTVDGGNGGSGIVIIRYKI